MSEETRRVLEMLAQGKLTVEEADQLLRAIGAPPPESAVANDREPAGKPAPRFFRVTVTQPGGDGGRTETVNVRVPMSVVRGGLRLGAIIPGMMGERTRQRLREKGVDVDFAKLDYGEIETLIKDLGELTIDVDDKHSQVRVRCE
jgi:hypothetical protein